MIILKFPLTTTRDKEHQYIILKGVVQQEDITPANTYAPNIGAPQYIKKILEDFKKATDSNTIFVGDFNTPLSTVDRSSKQKINKNIAELKDILDPMDLIDIYRTFYPKEAKYTFFSKAQGSFSKIDHMVDTKQASTNSRKLKSYQTFSLTTRD